VPRVSILLPCRDAAAFVDEAVASLLAQTTRDLDIIAVDDGSADDTAARLTRWSRLDPRLRVIAGSGGGIVAALNEGLTNAQADIIARMDADDVAHPTRIEKQLAHLDAAPETLACGTHVRYFPRALVREGARRYESWLNSLCDSPSLARDVYVECPIAHPTLMVRRTALESAGAWRETGWPEDYDLILRLHAAGALANVPEVLHQWRERPERLSRVDARYSPDAFRRCKAYHLARGALMGRRVLIVGAGPVGKAFAQALSAEGCTIAAFVEVDARKIGQTVHGAPVVARDAIGRYRGTFAVAAVGADAARADIREWLGAVGWREGEEFCAVA
jgi:glycosyltransferase involved in cell wall biosynthesis